MKTTELGNLSSFLELDSLLLVIIERACCLHGYI